MVFFTRVLFQAKRLEKPDLRVNPNHKIKKFIGFAAFLVLAFCPIYLYPLYNIQKFQDIQKETRKDINQEDVQPGGMKVWSDPFKSKKKE